MSLPNDGDLSPAVPPRRRAKPATRLQVILIAGVALIGVTLWSVYWPKNRHYIRTSLALSHWSATAYDDDPAVATSRATADTIRPLFTRKGTPLPGDWLATFDEPGQTFNQYLQTTPLVSRELPHKIAILPYGDFDARQLALVEEVAELVRLVYGIPVELLPATPLPPLPREAHYIGGEGQPQLLTDALLDPLRKRVPDDLAGLIALTPTDLTPGAGWNYVFGQASLVDRVGVWSLYRLADPTMPPEVQLRRTAGVTLHELGHMFGILHCTAYSCCMNGCNHLTELDREPLAFCPECDAKLCWRLGLDAQPRYEQLASWATEHGLSRDAAMWGKCAEALDSQ